MPPEDLLESSIPWKTIAASPDMMDVTFNNRRFPYAWRSSLAIAVYEPPRSDLAPNLCGQRIAFVKVTCSLTGYQAAGSETGTITFGDEPLEELERLTTEYLGCYGALLNVAVFPSGGALRVVGESPDLSVYPHILDFTPKTRELVRSITESGELLTGSTRDVGIDQSLTTTTKNETTIGLEAGYEKGFSATGKISHTWGTTEEDKRGLTVESGSSRTIKRAHSTSLDQLYSLLTGYHTGTNRATFIVLARPGTLQATNRRSFAQGLRMLEGVQDFILVVARPEEQDDLCIEASLKTGHFPETVELVGEGETVERRTFPFRVQAIAKGGGSLFDSDGETILFGTPDRPEDTFIVPGDGVGGEWIIDVDATDAGGGSFVAPGISLADDRTRTDPPTPGPVANHFDLRIVRVDDRTVQARGQIVARGGHDFTSGPNTIVDVNYNVHVRRAEPSAFEPTADVAQMLVTNRGLSVCYRAVDGCPQVVEPPSVSDIDSTMPWFDDLRPELLGHWTSPEGIHASIRSGLISGAAADARGVRRRAFVDTDYFSQKVARGIAANIAEVPVAEIADIRAHGVSPNVLGATNVRQLLSTSLRQYARGLDLEEAQALELRRAVLGYVETRLKGKA
ncbi:MAG: hypothetical protein GY711_23990 [bacterium]|nr:hypothetical protein [bacterium]